MLKEIIEKCLKMDLYEKRDITDEYCELVFHNKDKNELEKMLTGILGVAIKGPNLKPTKQDALVTKNYGGINNNQTLFKKEFEDGAVIVMLWPWQDDAHTTLKAALIKGKIL